MNRRIKYLMIGLLAMGSTLISNAGNITMNWSAFDVTGVSLAFSPGGLPTGCLLEIGTFTNGVPNYGLTNFSVFASGFVGDGGASSGFWTKSSVADDAGFAGTKVYIVVFDASTANAATQLGIFSTTLASWTFPHSSDPQTFRNIDIESLVSNAGTPFNTLSASAQIFYGSGLAYNSSDQRSYLKLGVIPEPSTLALVGLGLLTFVGLSKKRKR